ncbi:MAG: hypothetical protein EA376_00220 [Phycisphaeraceae bacterium]|nr:MAG: hypothetical protein EA376_00220 [Phycisphaeraceae bacterium]
MLRRWFPWKLIIRRAAHRHGFIDPFAILARAHRFAQPSEVMEPIELLRAGVIFHARGLINTRAIQHNLDWVWPYWVERQFNPRDVSFIPRAFSITHVNLTHRNWTAVGLPDIEATPIVDPRGLLTALDDKWSLDAWIVTDDGAQILIPCRDKDAEQELLLEDGLCVRTRSSLPPTDGGADLHLETLADMVMEEGNPVCRLRVTGRADRKAWLVVSLRPYNPEGVSFVHVVTMGADRRSWDVDGEARIEFETPMERMHCSTYREGDVRSRLLQENEQTECACEIGMATAAAMYEIEPGAASSVTVRVPLGEVTQTAPTWASALDGVAELRVPDERYQFLYDAALRTLTILSPHDVYPGPYTYKRFWFRDAAIIMHAMLGVGLADRVERSLKRFPARQTTGGYFRSQEGEWDSNGQVLWILERYRQMTGRPLDDSWRSPVKRAARWIERKRVSEKIDAPHAGLLPAGFSAEHLGPNDFYYWDDFWSIAGLEAAAALAESFDEMDETQRCRDEAKSLAKAVERSLEHVKRRGDYAGVPASPHRRMDAGAIGSIVCGYPLQLWDAHDPRLLATIEFLVDHCFVNGGFFQDMIHSGINPYLTIHVAQVMLRAGDERAFELIDATARNASPTGQWPEAIHPHTHGGCMGDGQHAWAAAEWVLMMRALFLREEGDTLVLTPGIRREWLDRGEELRFGPSPTSWGDVLVRVKPEEEGVRVEWEATWRRAAPTIVVRTPGECGEDSITPEPGQSAVLFRRETAV